MRTFVLMLLVLCGCASQKPAPLATTPTAPFSDFQLSLDPKRTHETTDIGVRGFWYAFDSEQKQQHTRCVELAKHMIEDAKAQKKVDFVKVLVSTNPDALPYFRYTWSRPDSAKTGEYEKYVVEENQYEK